MPWPGLRERRLALSATSECLAKNIFAIRGTSNFRSLATLTAITFTSSSANVQSKDGIKKSSKKHLRLQSRLIFERRWGPQRWQPPTLWNIAEQELSSPFLNHHPPLPSF